MTLVDPVLTSRCVYCGGAVDPLARDTWRRVVGWERKAQAATRKSGSDIALREPRDEYAHSRCVRGLQHGIDPGQGELL